MWCICVGRKSVAVLPQTQAILDQFGEQIKMARLRRHLSAELVAQRAGVSRATVGNVERESFCCNRDLCRCTTCTK